MSALLDLPEAAIPTQEETELATRASQVLAAKAEAELKIKLDDGTELTLPKAATRLLHYLLTQMSLGNAVTLIPIHAELTTQEAADYLNVSRPYLIKLLNARRIPYHMAGTHRRIRFTDLEMYRKNAEKEREAAMQELAKQAQELGMGY
jgi:excisionase family DNA binding protein